MYITYRESHLSLRQPFAIARTVFHEAKVITVRIEQYGQAGYGQCIPQARFGESVASVMEQLATLAVDTAADPLSRQALQEKLPAGAARNGLDCALWDLEAKRQETPVWRLAGLKALEPVATVYTLSLDTPDATREAAQVNAHRPLLKVKLGSGDDVARLEAARSGAPSSRLIVDANEGWSIERLDALAPILTRIGVEMVEQPLPAGSDDILAERRYPFALCADEACRERAALPSLRGKYNVINIKLDKVGGLTEALALRQAAVDQGFEVMVGCGVGSSLAIAPAFLLAQNVKVADLDGPLFLLQDCPYGLVYKDDWVYPPSRELWG